MASPSLLRIRLISVAIFLFSLLLIGRLFFLQIVRHDFYTDKADRQYQRSPDAAIDRGNIYFRQIDGTIVSAATMREGFKAVLNPSQLRDAELAYQKLSSVLTINPEDFFAKAAKTSDPHEDLADRLDQQRGEAIKALNLSGVTAEKTRWRFYPAGRTAAHVLGLVNREGEGTYGLEKYYDDTLRREGEESFSGFLAQVFSDFSGGDRQAKADLVLTIEPVVQNTLEHELGQLMTDWQAESAGAVVMDPNTGAILAMGAKPDFDPGAKQESIDYLANPLVERTYEMGSTFKPLTLAAGLDAGVIKPETTYKDEGTLTLNNKTISNYDHKARGVVPMQEILNQSLNTGAVFVMQKLGRERFRDYITHYGLTEPTGVDLPNEVEGLHQNLDTGREVELATISFGQGITVTPIAMARALAALANGGKLVRPYVVSEFRPRDTKISRQVEPEIGRQVIKPETSKTITQMLVKVVDTALLNGKYKMDNYSIAAKTGTAQQVGKDGGGYDPNRFLHSFFGYFPASNPKFLVFFYLVNPQHAPYASETLTAPFMTMTKFLLNYYHVPPDR